MTIPNVVLGELIDPVTFGNAVVDAVNEHETEIADRLPLSGGTLTGDLQVDGKTKAQNGTVSSPAYSFVNYPNSGFYIYAGDVFTVVDGQWYVKVSKSVTQIKNDLQVDGTINGTLTFGIAEGIDTADVLDRAETATMPVIDDEGLATTDDEVESVTVNEVITALLVKVKQLEERIEALEA